MIKPTAYSPATDTHYPNWDELVSAESNGWVAVFIMTNESEVWPYVVGPFGTKREAQNARARIRRSLLKGGHRIKVAGHVRPVWKPEVAE